MPTPRALIEKNKKIKSKALCPVDSAVTGGNRPRSMGRANGVGAEECDHLVGKDVLLGMAGSKPTKASPRSASDSSMVASCDSGTPLSLRPVFELPPSEEETEAALSILKQ